MSTIFSPRFILIALLVGIAFLLILIRFFPSSNNLKPAPSPTPISIIPNQPIEVGKSTTPSVEKLPNIVKKETLPDGSIVYTLSTSIPLTSDKIITKNDKVIFQSQTSSLNPSQADYKKISDFIKSYGQPDKIISGSENYGPFSSYYIYASKGFAFIGNPNTDEVYETQSFTPMSVDQYLQQFNVNSQNQTPAPEGP